MEILRKIENLLNRVLMVLGGIAILGLMLIASLNVLMRMFKVPFSGTYEIVGFLGAVVIAFALGRTQKRKENVMVDLVTQHFPTLVKRILDSIKYFLGFLFFSIIARQVYLWGMGIYKTGELSETLKIIYYPFVFCVALGFAVLSLTLLIDFIGTLVHYQEEHH